MESPRDTERGTVAPTLLLASRSPRRREMLAHAGVAHVAEHPGFEDGVLEPGRVRGEAWVMALAYLKAWAKAGEVSGREDAPAWVLGADTACLVDGRLVGTPASAAEAAAMIRGFVGRAHEVITGVALVRVSTGARELLVDRATVRFGRLDDAQISRYVESGKWAGKAGAYNLGERLEAGWPIEYEGDPGTIMGLPMRAMRRRFGWLFSGADGCT